MICTTKQYHGLSILHPLYNQQLKHLQTLIEESAKRTPTKMLLIASVE